MVDLHTHSNKSDGSYSPGELVKLAVEKNLSAIALTDHDTVAGLEEACEAAKSLPIEVIKGVELSSKYENKDIHIVGLFINEKAPGFLEFLTEFRLAREIRNEQMCKKLQEHGVNLSIEELKAAFPDAVITRGQYAEMIYRKGYTKSIPEAFERFVGDNSPCYVPRDLISPRQAIELIKQADGLAILAHPTLYHMSNSRLRTLVGLLKDYGLDGIEGKYTTYSHTEEREIKELATDFDLILSGGSDFHGKTKPRTQLGTGFGNLYVDDSVLEKLREKHQKTNK